MKKFLVALFSMLTLVAHAEESKPASADLLAGKAFTCVSPVKPVMVLNQPDNTPIYCLSPKDVRNTSGAVVIPRGSRFFGWKKGRRIEWTSWTTPNGIAVGEDPLHRMAFASVITEGSDEYILTAVRDISVPRPLN